MDELNLNDQFNWSPFLMGDLLGDLKMGLLQACLYVIDNKLLMVGERGFEPPTPWSRTLKLKTLSALYGVA